MKLLFCEDCVDIIAPDPRAHVPRWCRCGRHAVWWDNPFTGHLVLHDKLGGINRPGSLYDGMPGRPCAYLIGLHNAVLKQNLNAEQTRQLIDEADGYLFKTRGSLVIRLRPLESNDTRWSASLPEGTDATSD